MTTALDCLPGSDGTKLSFRHWCSHSGTAAGQSTSVSGGLLIITRCHGTVKYVTSVKFVYFIFYVYRFCLFFCSESSRGWRLTKGTLHTHTYCGANIPIQHEITEDNYRAETVAQCQFVEYMVTSDR